MIEYWNKLVNDDIIITQHRITIGNNVYEDGIFKSFPSFKHISNKYIGGFPSKTCEFVIYDHDEDIDIKGKEILLEIGHKIDNDIIWFKTGYFKITDIISDKSAKTIKCTGEDRTYLFNDKYKSDLNWENRHTGKEIIDEILKKIGIELDGNFAFENHSFLRPNFKFNISYREVISKIAEICGAIAIITNEGKLKIKKQTNKDILVEKKHRIDYSLEKPKGKISRISLGVEGYEDDYLAGTEKEGYITHSIENNPYCDLYRDEMANKILENLKDIDITEFEIKGFLDDCFLELNDKIRIKGNDDNITDIVVLGIENPGTFRSKVYCKIEESKKQEYTIAGSVKEDLKRVSLKVNHIKDEITAEIAKVTEKANELTKFQADIEGLKLWKEAQIDLADHREGIGKITTKEAEDFNVVKYQAEGGKLYRNVGGLYPSQTLYPSTTLFMPEKTGLEEIE